MPRKSLHKLKTKTQIRSEKKFSSKGWRVSSPKGLIFRRFRIYVDLYLKSREQHCNNIAVKLRWKTFLGGWNVCTQFFIVNWFCKNGWSKFTRRGNYRLVVECWMKTWKKIQKILRSSFLTFWYRWKNKQNHHPTKNRKKHETPVFHYDPFLWLINQVFFDCDTNLFCYCFDFQKYSSCELSFSFSSRHIKKQSCHLFEIQ